MCRSASVGSVPMCSADICASLILAEAVIHFVCVN